jgi:hypothetical protein
MDDLSLFSSQERERIREKLVAVAKADPRIAGAAHLGSAALGLEDRWSDIDLALSLAPHADISQVIDDWTTLLYRDHVAVANYDVRRGSTLYRVFLLANTLQIDLSFWPSNELRAIGPKFKLIFGAAGDPTPAVEPDPMDLIGMTWLYALHVRSSIARSRLLQAEHMLGGMRDNVLALMCKRHGVACVQGRGLDDLPQPQKARAEECLSRGLAPVELQRAFRVTVETFLEEVESLDSTLSAELDRPLRRMVSSLALPG